MGLFSPTHHFMAFRELLSLLTRHHQLTWEMAKREISDRYAGQILGTFWAVGHPLILMGIYVFVFAFVFKQKVGGTRELPLDYTVYLLSGLIPWMSFQECMSKSAIVILSNANLVKQVVFPTEILPVKGVIASCFTQVISTVVLLVYVLLSHGSLFWTYLLIPVLYVFQILAMVGVSYIFSAIGAYFRDLKDFIQAFCVMGIFLIPLFYLPGQLPAPFQPVLYLNPFSHMIWCYQDVLYFGRFEHPWSWGLYIAGSLCVFYAGYRIFRKLKLMFGNVL